MQKPNQLFGGISVFLFGVMHISCTNKTLKQMNDMRLNELIQNSIKLKLLIPTHPLKTFNQR